MLGFRSELSDAILRVRLLTAAAEFEAVSGPALCTKVGVSAGRAFGHLTRLVEQGHLVREQLEYPRRYVYKITDKGRRALPL